MSIVSHQKITCLSAHICKKRQIPHRYFSGIIRLYRVKIMLYLHTKQSHYFFLQRMRDVIMTTGMTASRFERRGHLS